MVMVCGRHGIGSSWCIRDGVSFTNSDKMNVYSLTPHLQIGVHHTAIRRLRERTIPRLVTYQPIQGRCNLPFIHGNEVSSLVETLDDECSQPVGKITMQFIHRWSVHIFLDVEMQCMQLNPSLIKFQVSSVKNTQCTMMNIHLLYSHIVLTAKRICTVENNQFDINLVLANVYVWRQW